jgi:acyl-CoA thioesterase-2
VPGTSDDALAGATIRSVGHEARAWWGDRLLAGSTRALRLDADGRAPTLWFPWDDVRAEGLTSAGAEPWGGGEVERFDADGPAPGGAGVAWHDEPAGPSDGTGAVRRWLVPPPGLQALAGHATVDHDQARVELLEGGDGADLHAVTVTRFPNWGDAAELIDVLDARSVVRDHRRPVVEASQILGQAIVLAMRHAPGRRVVSSHLVALRPCDANRPMDFELDELAHGRTFTSVVVRTSQGGRCCASTTLLLGVPATDVVAHAAATEPVAGPLEAVPHDMGVTGRDLRVVDAAYTDDPAAAVGSPVIDAWVRFREVPDDPAIHAGLLAQFAGHMSIAAALRPHAGVGQREAHRSISTAINAIAWSAHADARVDRWVRYRHLATVVQDGMGHSECRVYDEDDGLLASFTVDFMLRPLDRPSPDARTAL